VALLVDKLVSDCEQGAAWTRRVPQTLRSRFPAMAELNQPALLPDAAQHGFLLPVSQTTYLCAFYSLLDTLAQSQAPQLLVEDVTAVWQCCVRECSPKQRVKLLSLLFDALCRCGKYSSDESFVPKSAADLRHAMTVFPYTLYGQPERDRYSSWKEAYAGYTHLCQPLLQCLGVAGYTDQDIALLLTETRLILHISRFINVIW
jgi:hypothetical protein